MSPGSGGEDDVPKLPRGRFLRLSGPHLVRFAGTLFLLVFLIVAQRPCANAVSTFVTGFGGSNDPGSATAAMPRPGTVDVPASSGTSAGSAAVGSAAAGSAATAGTAGSGSAAGGDGLRLDQYEHLRPDMTEDEIKAVIERARRKAAGGSAAP